MLLVVLVVVAVGMDSEEIFDAPNSILSEVFDEGSSIMLKKMVRRIYKNGEKTKSVCGVGVVSYTAK